MAQRKPEDISPEDLEEIASGEFTPSTREGRRRIAAWLCQLIQQDRTSRQDQFTIWDTIDGYYQSRPAGADVAPSDGWPALGMPLIPPRIKAVASQIVNVVSRAQPKMLADTGLSDEDSNTAEAIVDLLWTQGGFAGALSLGVLDCLLYNKAVWRLSFQVEKRSQFQTGFGHVQTKFAGPTTYAGLRMERIDPRAFVICPAVPIEDATLVGHRFYMPENEIKQRMRLDGDTPGTPQFFPDDVDSALTPSTAEGDDQNDGGGLNSTNPQTFSGLPETALIECFQVVVWCAEITGELKRYRATVAYKTQTLLTWEPWEDTWSGYFDAQAEDDATTESFWPEISVGRNMIPLADMYNKLWSLFYAGCNVSALKPIVGPRPLASKDEQIGGLQYAELDSDPGDPQPWSPTIDFEAEALVGAIKSIEQQADVMSRNTAQNLGTPEAEENTATGINALTQAASIGVDDFILRITRSFPAMAAYSTELVTKPKNWDLFAPLWGYTDLPEPLLELRTPTAWQPSGQTQASQPTVRYMQLSQLMELAANPETMIDTYKLTTAMLVGTKVPGAKGFQVERNAELKKAAIHLIEQGAMVALEARAGMMPPNAPSAQGSPAPGQPAPAGGGANKGKPKLPGPSVRVAGTKGVAMPPQDAGGGGSLPPSPEATVGAGAVGAGTGPPSG